MREATKFEGGVFSATIAGGRAGARLWLGHDALHAETVEGEFRLPFAECELERGGASGRMWFCRTRDRSLTLFSEAPGFAAALRSEARRELAEAFARIDREQRAERKRGLYTWLALIAAIVALLAGGVIAVRQAGRASVDLLPTSIDETLGELALEHMSLGGPVTDDPVLRRGLDELIARLSAQVAAPSRFRFRVRVVESATVNAFALPGGFLVVYTGLLRSADTPEQVAGVLAHEMAHVDRRHGMQRIAQSLGVVAAIQLLFGDVSGLAAIAVEVLREGAINRYSRDQEREADRDAVHTLAAAGLDPRALAGFFTLLEHKETPGSWSWLGTHPELRERITAVEKESAHVTLANRPPLALRWDELQRHAGGRTAPAP